MLISKHRTCRCWCRVTGSTRRRDCLCHTPCFFSAYKKYLVVIPLVPSDEARSSFVPEEAPVAQWDARSGLVEKRKKAGNIPPKIPFVLGSQHAIIA